MPTDSFNLSESVFAWIVGRRYGVADFVFVGTSKQLSIYIQNTDSRFRTTVWDWENIRLLDEQTQRLSNSNTWRLVHRDSLNIGLLATSVPVVYPQF